MSRTMDKPNKVKAKLIVESKQNFMMMNHQKRH